MPRRHILTERQRKVLFDLPTDEGALLRHYILDNDDIEHIRTRLRIPGYSATHSDSIWPPKPEYPATCGALR